MYNPGTDNDFRLLDQLPPHVREFLQDMPDGFNEEMYEYLTSGDWMAYGPSLSERINKLKKHLLQWKCECRPQNLTRARARARMYRGRNPRRVT